MVIVDGRFRDDFKVVSFGEGNGWERFVSGKVTSVKADGVLDVLPTTAKLVGETRYNPFPGKARSENSRLRSSYLEVGMSIILIELRPEFIVAATILVGDSGKYVDLLQNR